MNAIPPCQPESADERTARQLRVCAELTGLGMDLARAAAARALADLAGPEAAPSAPEPSGEPPATQPAQAARPARAAAAKTTNPGVIFIRTVAAIRDVMALEARLAAGGQTTGRTATRERHADPRRAPLRDAFNLVTKNHPDRIDLIRESTVRLDEELAADAAQTYSVPELLFLIADELGIEIDLATLPDEYLGFDPEARYAGDEDDDAPDPRATSPP